MKENHSKVMGLKHPILKMQQYLMPNDERMKKEDCQIIFQLRSKVTNAKMNQKNRYESYECEVCGLADESQEHVLNCEVIREMHNEWDKSEIPSYNKLTDGSIKEKILISKMFSKNMKIIENLRKNRKSREPTQRDQVTKYFLYLCLQ